MPALPPGPGLGPVKAEEKWGLEMAFRHPYIASCRLGPTGPL